MTGNFISILPFSILQRVPRELHLFTILFITRGASDDEDVTVFALNSQIFVGTTQCNLISCYSRQYLAEK